MADETYHNIQRAKDVLLDEQMRAKYDNWRQSGILVSWDQWLALQEKTHLVGQLFLCCRAFSVLFFYY
jgi:DnaJ family protein C protein 12